MATSSCFPFYRPKGRSSAACPKHLLNLLRTEDQNRLKASASSPSRCAARRSVRLGLPVQPMVVFVQPAAAGKARHSLACHMTRHL
jgi:hypothetical protein